MCSMKLGTYIFRVNTQFRAYLFYKAPEWIPHKKIVIKFDSFLAIAIRPSPYFAVPDSKNLCNR